MAGSFFLGHPVCSALLVGCFRTMANNNTRFKSSQLAVHTKHVFSQCVVPGNLGCVLHKNLSYNLQISVCMAGNDVFCKKRQNLREKLIEEKKHWSNNNYSEVFFKLLASCLILPSWQLRIITCRARLLAASLDFLVKTLRLIMHTSVQ